MSHQSINDSNGNETSNEELLINKNKGFSYISVDPDVFLLHISTSTSLYISLFVKIFQGMNFKIPSFLDNTDTLLELWKSGSLCDVILYSKDNIPFKVHHACM